MAATSTTIGGALLPNALGVEAATARSRREAPISPIAHAAIGATLGVTGGGNAAPLSTPAATRHLGRRTRLAD
jgi:hypothetical protein